VTVQSWFPAIKSHPRKEEARGDLKIAPNHTWWCLHEVNACAVPCPWWLRSVAASQCHFDLSIRPDFTFDRSMRCILKSSSTSEFHISSSDHCEGNNKRYGRTNLVNKVDRIMSKSNKQRGDTRANTITPAIPPKYQLSNVGASSPIPYRPNTCQRIPPKTPLVIYLIFWHHHHLRLHVPFGTLPHRFH
jgi:hypothetical protein